MRLAAALLGALVLVAAGCAADGDGEVAPTATGAGTLEVPLRVVSGPEGSTLAFAEVWIDGNGPYAFALDTGASRSLVDRRLLDEIGAEPTGTIEDATGVFATGEPVLVDVTDWRVGDVELPDATIVSAQLPRPDVPEGAESPRSRACSAPTC